MKQKNGFFTLVFACVPGAGQMYQGYMKRGLSLVTAFAAMIWLSSLIGPFVVFACVAYMYSFFDTLNLRAQIIEGTAPQDEFLYHLGIDSQLQKSMQSGHKVLGWALVAAGVYALYENFMSSILGILWDLGLHWLANLLQELPTMALCFALIAVGLWLVRGPSAGAAKAPAADEINFYAAPRTEPAAAQPQAAPAADIPQREEE